jgi:hypothetical protein
MIKILIVLEEENNIDFRAYALQISDRSKGLPPQATLQLTESTEQLGAANSINPSPHTPTEDNCRSLIYQRRPLETRQIFMN